MNFFNKSIVFGKLLSENPITVNLEPIGPKEPELVLKKGCEVLDALGCHYWISAGTLLGLHRDKAFIKHDTDLDIGLICDENNQDLLEKVIEKMPFKLAQIIRSGGYTQLAFIGDDNIVFDIYIYYKLGGHYVNWTPDGVLYFPTALLDNLTTLTFKDHTYPCPSPDDYCRVRYGESWRTPKNFKDRWREDTFNLILYTQWGRQIALYLRIFKVFLFG